ncbi:MAG: Gfo/Idh/MocA family oxidoreductase [Ilumatobacteraceae bacterium]|nr:Gfo/Idh/MocA family oxidoreductase [Ilumatobacteraceae bacterium]
MSVKWGFLGAGFVATAAMAPAVHAARNAKLYGVASRSQQRSQALGPTRVYATYDALLDDTAIDAVYISLANNQHFEWVTKALHAGKHVLCEKPLALNAKEAQQLFETAKQCDRALVEAVWARWHPRFRRIEELVASGSLGALQSIDSTFTSISQFTDNYRLVPEMGGGALLDVGCYQVHSWVALTNGAKEFQIQELTREIGPTAVDLTTSVKACINGTVNVHAVSSFVMDSSQSLVITGEKNNTRTHEGEAFTTWRKPSSLLVGDVTEVFDAADAFVIMTENVSSHIMDGSGWIVPLSDSVRVAQILDTIAACVILQ